MREDTLKALDNTLAAIQIIASAIQTDTNDLLDEGDEIQIIRHFDTLRRVNEEIKVARKSLEIIEDKLSHTQIPDLFRARHIKNINVEGIGRVSIGHKWACSIIDKQEGFQWLRDTGNEGLIIETVNSSTLAAFAKNMMELNGTELPQDVFKTSINAYTSISKT